MQYTVIIPSAVGAPDSRIESLIANAAKRWAFKFLLSVCLLCSSGLDNRAISGPVHQNAMQKHLESIRGGACPRFSNRPLVVSYDDDDLYSSKEFSFKISPRLKLAECDEILPNGPVESIAGNVSRSPNISLDFSRNNDNRFLVFKTISTCDSILLINAANGAWHFDDDSDGHDARVPIYDSRSGTYDIWIGTYNDAECTVNINIETFNLSSDGYIFYINSNCNNNLEIVIYFEDAYGDWRAEGWYNFGPYEYGVLAVANVDLRSRNRRYYIYAREVGTDRAVQGEYQIYFNGDLIGMKEVESSGENGELVRNISCD